MSTQVIPSNTESSILARILQPDQQQITPDVARYLVSIQLPHDDEERVNELSSKARAGSLTAAEEQELDGYLHIGTQLAILQSKARQFHSQRTRKFTARRAG